MATLKELSDFLQGTVVGNPKLNIQGVSTIKDGKPGTITFMVHQKYFKYVESTQASAVIASDSEILNGLDGIIVNNPKLAMVKILDYFSPQYPLKKGIHKTAIIDPDTVLGKGVSIGPYTIIDRGVIIGDNTVIGANNVINADTVIGCDSEIENNIHLHHRTIIGDRCLIHSGTVIGCDGFGFFTENDINYKISQNGNVTIGNDVELGANCTIDRGTIGETTIGDMCKFDNSVQIAHNVSIGKGCLLTAHVTIAGSTKVGKFCSFGGQAGAIDHISIGDRAILACYTVAMKDLPGGKTYAGAPAREIKDKNRRDAVHIEVKRLKDKMIQLEKSLLVPE
ncbi:MAG: UDP-3-O-(3-hydroxymyristoyl)glucosamine N-acyltransferase [Candidatus Marinimicrobia bacterium]|nr:UDP-3-O-(3-hydroxymyristoyl)glucosamine N-acyltransferase [Candidatus Neomarinimicrobiota bacterium]